MKELHCPSCGDLRPVEQPPCPDRHAECPEWVCLDCGTVLVLGWLAIDAPAPRSRTHAAA